MINDKLHFVANFWRAVRTEPEALAELMDWPINEDDLHTRQKWLLAEGRYRLTQVENDPHFYDVTAAAYWAWGASCWIGSNWATDGRRAKPNMTPRGINRLGLDDWSYDGYTPKSEAIRQYLLTLSTRLRQVRVLCGDWKRCVKASEMRAGKSVGVFLDPPYAHTTTREGDLYYHDDPMTEGILTFCNEWAGSHVRIVLAGMEGEYDLPGWKVVTWSAKRSFPSSNNKTNNVENRHRERLWLSPEKRRRVIPRTPSLT
jgi:hypothetical protein